MSFMNRLKGEQDIIALCEAFAVDQNSSYQKTNEAIEADEQKNEGDDAFNPDDLFNTVDIPEDAPAQSGPSFSADEIELTTLQKEEIKKALSGVLDEVQDKESISDPALEMIVNEVANRTSYLSEAEEANLNGPVEKDRYRVGLIEAIKLFINELLGIAVDNGGELPADVDNLGTEGAGEAGEGALGGEAGEGTGEAGEAGEGAGESGEGAGGEAGEPSEEEKKEAGALQESTDAGDGTDASAVEPESAVQESACLGNEGVVDVDPSEVVRVVDDNDPGVSALTEPLAGGLEAGLEGGELEGGIAGALGAPEGGIGEDGGVSDDTPLTVGVLKQIVGQFLSEGTEGEKSFAELWKNLAGNAIVLPKPSTKGDQKTADPKGKAPDGTSYSAPTNEAGNESSLPKPSNKGDQKTADPKGKAPEGTQYTNPSTKPAGSAPAATKPAISKEEAANLVAATLNESNSKKTLAFLQEAASAMKNAKASLNS